MERPLLSPAASGPGREPAVWARRWLVLRLVALLGGLVLFGAGLSGLTRTTDGLSIRHTWSGSTPATVFASTGTRRAPAVVVVHGLSGSQQVMDPYAVTLARAGLVAITIDLPGHGRNPQPWVADDPERLDAAVSDGVALARRIGSGRVGLLGHSMGGFSVLMQAANHPGIDATVVLSSPAPTDPDPQVRNLLVMAGQFEPGLRGDLASFAAASGGGTGTVGQTYGSLAAGTARRAVVAPLANHAGILFSHVALAESRAWLTTALTGRAPPQTPVDNRAPWLLATFAGAGLLMLVLAGWLPRLGIRARRNWRWQTVAGSPAWWAVAVGGYLLGAVVAAAAALRGVFVVPLAYGSAVVVVLGVTGLVMLAGLPVLAAVTKAAERQSVSGPDHDGAAADPGRRAVRAALALLCGAVLTAAVLASFGVPTQLYLLQLRLIPARLDVLPLVLIGCALWAFANAALMAHPRAPAGAPAVLIVGFGCALVTAVLASLAILGFLLLVGLLLVFASAVTRLIGYVAWRRTSSWIPGAVLETVALAWLVTATFPLLG